MIYRPQYFDLEELVCPHVYYRFGQMAWQFFDPTALQLIDWLRKESRVPIYANNWHHLFLSSSFVRYIREQLAVGRKIRPEDIPEEPKGILSQRGLRCNVCSLVYKKAQEGTVYVSPHMLGKGFDLDIQGQSAEESRQWLKLKESQLPCNVRVERGVEWLHIDTEDTGVKLRWIDP